MVTVDVDEFDPLLKDILLSNPNPVTQVLPQQEKTSSSP